jgi:C1A family cysteine protease
MRLFGKKKIVTPKWKYGFIADKPDKRDFLYQIRLPKLAPESTERKNINAFPWRYNQGNIGSCVGNGVVEAFRRVLQVNNQPDFDLSRLFAYYIAREDKLHDTGASIRDAFKAINQYGICSESVWPYNVLKYAFLPSNQAFLEALEHQSIRYESLPQKKEYIMDAVYSGFPVVYGKSIYESFETEEVTRTGIVPYPRKCREQFLGGHCMVIFDYDKNNTIELNSWGSGWGQEGICTVPWKYVLDSRLCRDFWVFYLTE